MLRTRFVLVQAIALFVVFTVIGGGAQLAQMDRSAKAQAQQRAVAAQVARYQAQAYFATIQQRDAAQARAQELQQALDTTTADRDQLKQKVDQLQGQVNALQAASVGVGSGPATMQPTAGPNHFPWGWCTYYVASRRWVPWNGNAISWLWGARAYGYPTGSAPRAGAIMVTAESIWGHVAYVEEVSGGSFLVSEMNYYRWGVVDFRRVVPGTVPVLGFIY